MDIKYTRRAPASPNDCPSGLQWWVCFDISGCCATDPCNNVDAGQCPDGSHDPSETTTSSTPQKTATRHPSKTTSATAATTTTFATSITATATGPPATTDTTPVASPSGTLGEGDGTASLPTAAVAGISVGATVCVIALVAIVCLLIRRRRLAKRMPYRRGGRGGHSPDPVDAVKFISEQHSPAQGCARDVFAEFGGKSTGSKIKPSNPGCLELSHFSGRASSMEADRSPHNHTKGDDHDETRPLHQGSPGLPSSYTVSSTSTTRPLIKKQKTQHEKGETERVADEPVQLDSRAICFELDSSSVAPKRGRCDPQEPSPLSPTFPSIHNNQRVSILYPSPLSPAFSPTQPLSRLAPDHQSHSSSDQPQTQPPVSSHRNSDIAPPGAHRATLNATETEKHQGQHVVSWALGYE
ncbi:hypothetical protein F4778DRAFT_751984 [Xylariomycetidae sp. FL2044]|nr:hypothetical protein F4778DRAFT_751984 [Xylariomycetidae sp. FL2044]